MLSCTFLFCMPKALTNTSEAQTEQATWSKFFVPPIHTRPVACRYVNVTFVLTLTHVISRIYEAPATQYINIYQIRARNFKLCKLSRVPRVVNEIVDRAAALTKEKNTNRVMRIRPFMLFPRLNQALFFERKEYASHIY